ncbi:hypothetical protein Tco_0309797 [Tanacetum coccineum]
MEITPTTLEGVEPEIDRLETTFLRRGSAAIRHMLGHWRHRFQRILNHITSRLVDIQRLDELRHYRLENPEPQDGPAEAGSSS